MDFGAEAENQKWPPIAIARGAHQGTRPKLRFPLNSSLASPMSLPPAPSAPAPHASAKGKRQQGRAAPARGGYVETLADTRLKLASAIGYAARRLWRRKDLEDVDTIILDLICEALQRIGHSYRPREGDGALQALARAPSHIQELVSSLENLARPGNPDGDAS